MVGQSSRRSSFKAMGDLKENWKARFDQLDIWITAYRIEVV
jgi:hypothetical protein